MGYPPRSDFDRELLSLQTTHKMGQYSMERPCPEDFKTYKTISVDGRSKNDQFYCEILKILKSMKMQNLKLIRTRGDQEAEQQIIGHYN